MKISQAQTMHGPRGSVRSFSRTLSTAVSTLLSQGSDRLLHTTKVTVDRGPISVQVVLLHVNGSVTLISGSSGGTNQTQLETARFIDILYF
ncbi:hypothetical protein VTK56DRAFT_1434 [Thermocarpiscus australiensis]